MPNNSKPLSHPAKYTNHAQAGVSALEQCGIYGANLSFISDTGNIIFRADVNSRSYCIRVYPERFRTVPEINGELDWLLALRRETDITVPQPVATESGQFVQELHLPHIDEPFQIVVFDWLPGQVIGNTLNRQTARRMGELMATLHTHAEGYKLAANTFRDTIDWRGMELFTSNLSDIQRQRIEEFLTAEQITLCNHAAKRTAATINSINIERNFGLIHSDFHAKNCLFNHGDIHIIDFEDCQFSPFTGDLAIMLASLAIHHNTSRLWDAFLAGYLSLRDLPTDWQDEVEAFAIERKLRLIRWVSTWPRVDYSPSGQTIIDTGLQSCSAYLTASRSA